MVGIKNCLESSAQRGELGFREQISEIISLGGQSVSDFLTAEKLIRLSCTSEQFLKSELYNVILQNFTVRSEGIKHALIVDILNILCVAVLMRMVLSTAK